MSMTAREFMNEMERYINSPNQKLIGDPDGGYVYDPEFDAKTAYLMKEKHMSDLKLADTRAKIEEYRKQQNIKNGIEKVIFNGPATIVRWRDGTKTVVKIHDEEAHYDKEKALAMAIVKKMCGNTGRYYEIFKKWCPEEEEKELYHGLPNISNLFDDNFKEEMRKSIEQLNSWATGRGK